MTDPRSPRSEPPGWLVERLARAGCVAPDEEARELLEAAAGDAAGLEALVIRREAGEPLAWITGWVDFAGLRVRVEPGVYVPRWQTWQLAARAAQLMPDDGLAVDLCTGSGAIAAALRRAHPRARVLATDIDPLACRCAAANGVEVYEGYLADPLPFTAAGQCDVVIGVVPYVPTDSLVYLPRDVIEHEPRLALDGGPAGLRLLTEAVAAAGRLLRPGGTVLLEMGGEQDVALTGPLSDAGFEPPRRHLDEDGDLRGLEATRGGGGVLAG